MMQPDNEQENPPCQPSKYVRFARSFTLFVIDVVLWTCFWPRGTQFGCRTLGIVTTRYIVQGVWTLCSYALYSTLLVQSGQEEASFVSDSTSRLLGLPQQGCRRLKREASLHDIFNRGDQPGSDEDLDELAHNFLEAIDRAKATYSEEDIISTVETSWGNKTEFEDSKLDIYIAAPSGNVSKPGMGSADKPMPATSNETMIFEEQKQVSLEDLSMDQNLTAEVDSQEVNPDDTLRQDHLMMETWLRQNNISHLPGSSSNQSIAAKKDSEVKVVTSEEKMGDQVNSSVDPDNSTLAMLSLKSIHPHLFPANSGNGTNGRKQAEEAETEGFTREKKHLLKILMGCSFTVATLVVLLVLYALLCSEFSIGRVRARYLLARQNAEAQQDLAFQFMDIASDRESLRLKTHNLERKLKEKTEVGSFAIRTGLDNEPEHADYTVDIRRDVNLKRGMDQAQLEEVRQNIKRNKAIVDEMSENIDKSG